MPTTTLNARLLQQEGAPYFPGMPGFPSSSDVDPAMKEKIDKYEEAFTKKAESGDFDDNIDRAVLAKIAIDLLRVKSGSKGQGGNKPPSESGEKGEGDEKGERREQGEGDEKGKGREQGEGDEKGKGREQGEGDENGEREGDYIFVDDKKDFEKGNFDSEACDSGTPPEAPTKELLEILNGLSYPNFNLVTQAARMEYIGVFEFDEIGVVSSKPVYVGFSSATKGAVSIPTSLLSDTSKRFLVTHNHPNSSCFSDADFKVFNKFTSIKELVATTQFADYLFQRSPKEEVTNYQMTDKQVDNTVGYVRDYINEELKIALDTGEPRGFVEAKNQNKLDYYLHCTKEGAKFWTKTTTAAWYNVSEDVWNRTDGFSFSVRPNDRTAYGEFGTNDNSSLLLIARRALAKSLGDSGLGDDSRHKAPYRDEEGFFSPAYDVSKSFPGIYTMSFAKALNEYGTGSESDPESLQIIRNIQNDPEAKVKIYRAVEKGLQDNISDLKQDRKYINRNGSVPPWTDVPPHSADEYSEFIDSQIENLGSVEGASIQPTINPKDWVAISRQYAIDHGEASIPNGYTILTKTVKAKELFTEGNSINEWGYDPTLDDSNLSGDGFVPPESVQKEAERGLEWRREFNRGGTEVGVARARDLSNGRSVSLDTLKRMKAYFDRHQVDKNAEGFRLGEDGYPTAGRIAWALWGGDAGYNWAKSIVAKHSDGLSDDAASLDGKILNVQENEQQKETAPFTTQDVVNMPPPESLPLQGELKEFLTNLLAKFNMLIWGGAGSGKSSFVLRLANELAETNTGRVLYFMTEEKVSSGRLKARMDLMKAYSENVNFDDQGTIDRLTALVNTGMYRYVIVDSINMINAEQKTIVELMQTFPEVSWVFIAQATKGKNAYAGIQSLAHGVDTEIATTNDKGTATAELRKHRDGPLKTHTIFGNSGMRDPKWKATW